MISQISVKPSPSMSPHSTLLRHLRYNRCGDCTVTLKRDQKGAHFLVFRTSQLVISKLSKALGKVAKKNHMKSLVLCQTGGGMTTNHFFLNCNVLVLVHR